MVKELDWYQTAVFYEVYIRAFMDSKQDGNGDIGGLIQKLDYIKELGVDCIWILPHYPSPLKDDGYDISDYYDIHPDYGSLEDFKSLVDEIHARGLKLIVDLVVNHTSDQHEWFQQARLSKKSTFRDYYVWSDDNQKYSDARIIFSDTESSNWTWDESSQQFYWHRFYSSQPDLNYDNPLVEKEIFRVAAFWLDLGVDGFRVDAVPYLFEREGTNCENLPETHGFLKRLRRFMDENYPDKIILSEANQWPEDVRPYFGVGDEVHMNFHFPLMPRVFMALKNGDSSPLREILARTPDIPENCQWCTFLRNHDELTLEMVTEEEREWMWQMYAPEPRMVLNLGIRRRLAPLLDNEYRKILLANSLLMTLPGSPVIYYGDEIGMGDNIHLKDRDGVRTPMQWNNSMNAGFSKAPSEMLYAPVINDSEFGYSETNVKSQKDDSNSIYHMIKNMIAKRKKYQAFGKGLLNWVGDGEHDDMVIFWRTYQQEKMLILNNLSGKPKKVDLVDLTGFDRSPKLALAYSNLNQTMLDLEPYGFAWLDYSK